MMARFEDILKITATAIVRLIRESRGNAVSITGSRIIKYSGDLGLIMKYENGRAIIHLQQFHYIMSLLKRRGLVMEYSFGRYILTREGWEELWRLAKENPEEAIKYFMSVVNKMLD